MFVVSAKVTELTVLKFVERVSLLKFVGSIHRLVNKGRGIHMGSCGKKNAEC